MINTLAHYYTVAHVTATTALKQIDPEFEAVSASLKVPFWQTFRRVSLPICLPTVLELFVYLFVNAMTTVSAVIFLYGPSTKLAAIAIVHMDEAGTTAAAAAMASVIMATRPRCPPRSGAGQPLRDRPRPGLAPPRGDRMSRDARIAESEGDTNRTDRRAAWQARSLDTATRGLLARDSDAFLHQSVSTPCLNAIVRAEGIWIEDAAGRRYMDFHGNNVHHIGYGHPRLKRAIAEQMDALPFAPRRYACEPAVALAEKLAAITPGNLAKVLFTTGGSDAVEVAVKVARTATGRHKTLSFWDAFHGAGTGSAAMSGEMLFRSGPAGPLVAGALHVAPFGGYRCPYGTDSAEASGRACARMIDYVLTRDPDVAGPRRRADAGSALHPAAGLLGGGPAHLRPARRIADLRRDPHRPGQDRADVLLRA